MAGLSSDYIQGELLNQSIAMNDNLSAMRQILLDVEKNTKNGSGGSGSGSGSGGGNNNRRNNRNSGGNNGNSFAKALKDIFGESFNVGRTVLGNNGNIQNTVGAVATGAKVLSHSLGMLPGPIGLAAQGFGKIVEVGAQVYEYLNEQLNMYNQLNSAGLSLVDGMMTVRKGAGPAFMSINEFGAALQKNSDAVAAMDAQYGDGVEHFGKLLNSVQLAQEQIGLYGVSQQQLADITAKNFKYEKMYSGQAALNSLNEQQSTEKFVGQMTYLSKTVGKSVDELLNKFNSFGDNLDTGLAQAALQNYYGLSEKNAAEVTKSMNSIFASMGAAGDQLQKLNSSKLQLGRLPEEYNNAFTQMYTDRLAQLQASGITDEKVLRKAMSQYVKDHQQQLDNEIVMQAQAGNTTAAAWLQQLKNVERLVNDPSKQPSPIIEEFTNRFNMWIGKTFTEPFNKFYAETQEKAAKYLLDLANNSDGAWDFSAKLVRDALKAIPKIFDDGMLYLQNLLEGWAHDLFGDSYDRVSKSFENFMNDFTNLPQKLWDSITSWWDSNSEEKAESTKTAVNSLFDNITGIFKNLGNMDISFDGMKKSFMDMYNSLNDKLNSAFNRLKSWWNGDDEKKPAPTNTNANNAKPISPTASQPKTAGVQKVTSPPEYTKPEKIEQADQTSPEPVQTASSSSDNDSVNKLLSGILNNLETQGQTNSQLAIILRQIAENTEPPRNV